MPNPYKELATILESRMKKHASNATIGIPCELGTITANGLKLDNFKYEIQDYIRVEHLKELSEGDRVIAIPVNGGKDYAIIAKVV